MEDYFQDVNVSPVQYFLKILTKSSYPPIPPSTFVKLLSLNKGWLNLVVGIRRRIQRESMRELGDEKAVSILINVMFTLCFCQNSLKFTPEKSEFYHIQFKKKNEGTSLEVQELRLHLLMQRVWVQSLVGELSSHMPCGQKKQNINWKQYYNKFNKDFKNRSHQKNLSKK